MNEIAAKSTQRAATNLDSYWMPFSHNRYFKQHPAYRLLASAHGAYYTTVEGRKLFDCLSGLWCVNLGHGHPRIAAALQKQFATIDYSPAFQMGYPETFRLAERLGSTNQGPTRLPPPIDHFRVDAWGQSAAQWRARRQADAAASAG